MKKNLPILILLLLLVFGCIAKQDSDILEYISPEKNMVRVEGGEYIMGDWLPVEEMLDEQGNPVINSFGEVVNKYHDLDEELTGGENIKDVSVSKKLKNDFTQDARALHRVEVNSLYVSKYEVTFEEFDRFSMETKGYLYSDGFEGDDEYQETHWGRGKRPAIFVSWIDAVKYCNWISVKEGLEPCYDIVNDSTVEWDQTKNGYRLPTEAEWEYVARGGEYIESINEGNGSLYAGYEEVPTEEMMMPGSYLTLAEANENNLYEELKKYAIFTLTSGWKASADEDIPERDIPKNDNGSTMEVGTKLPTRHEIYDMSGNVWEWCWDFYSKDYYNYFTSKSDENCVVLDDNTDVNWPDSLDEPVYETEIDPDSGKEVLKLDEDGYPIPSNPNDPKWVYWPHPGDDDYPENDISNIDVTRPKPLPGQATYNKSILQRDENHLPIYKSDFDEWKNPIGPMPTDPKYSSMFIAYGHTLRGGTWGNHPMFLRTTFRFFSKKQNATKDPYYANWRTGFRIVRTASE